MILQFALNILFVVGLERGVQGILEAGVISGIIAIILLTPIAIKNKKFVFSGAKLKEILLFSIPLIPAAISNIVLTLSNRYFLDYYISKKEVGLYQIGVGLANVLTVIITKPFKIAWPPYMYSVAGNENAKEIYRNVLVYYVFIALWAGMAVSISAKEALIILTTPPFYSAYQIVPLLVVSLILFGMMEILVAGIHITKKTKYVSYIFMVAAVINLGLNYFLIPLYGMYGAATATVITFLFMNIYYFIYSQKLYPIQHDFARIFTVLGVSVFLFFIGRYMVTSDNLLISIPLKTLLIFSFPLILWIIRFFNAKEKEKIIQIAGSLIDRVKRKNK
jgi:O-antigen/teichoic acid export membrane protein